jgi:3-oxoacyl-[acyl-carrier-protein] synthase II
MTDSQSPSPDFRLPAPAGKRVVITGLGAVTPVGNTLADTWRAFVDGRSGVSTITRFDPSIYDVKIAGEVKEFSLNGLVSPKEARHMDLCSQYAVMAACEAVADSGLEITDANAEQVGVVFGSGGGGVGRLLEQERILAERGPDRVSPNFLPHFLADSASGILAIILGAMGPNMAVVSACATGAHAIGEAFETIRRGDAEAIVAGGAEAAVLPVILAGFINMRALVGRNDEPERASRPFDLHRAGFVLSEGAGAVIVESLEHALARGAPIHAEVAGYGSTNDAFHMAAPREGRGAVQCMRMALRKAGLEPREVDYINAHGTSTPLNDKYESTAIKEVFGQHAYDLSVSSTKSMVGHMMGAAGAVESIACIKAIQDGTIPPTINYETPDPECDLDYTVNQARKRKVDVAMTNSFGLGGHNSCVVFRKYHT